MKSIFWFEHKVVELLVYKGRTLGFQGNPAKDYAALIELKVKVLRCTWENVCGAKLIIYL